MSHVQTPIKLQFIHFAQVNKFIGDFEALFYDGATVIPKSTLTYSELWREVEAIFNSHILQHLITILTPDIERSHPKPLG
ncbi:hypothetical protein NQ318_007217 [Aromia moschata]|uniref:Uncharacterized protein n=1 Tax=Aromia moschata TaxID=1265417 RepID=A0AAV8Y6Q8_9CUCU|nr:hypothetical protein NQ318_007217 [Aromia moschata]